MNRKDKFLKATRYERKVIVAKDVLRNIKALKYIVATGRYTDFNFIEGMDRSKSFNITDIPSCRVCLLGACTLSIATCSGNSEDLLYSDCVGSYFSENEKICKILLSVFTVRELIIMEKCFEGACTMSSLREYYNYDSPLPLIYTDNYYVQFGAVKCLSNIMKNIIRNKGRFYPIQDLKGLIQ